MTIMNSIEMDIRICEEIMIRTLADSFDNYNGVLFARCGNHIDYPLMIVPSKPLLVELLRNKFIYINEIKMQDYNYFMNKICYQIASKISISDWSGLSTNGDTENTLQDPIDLTIKFKGNILKPLVDTNSFGFKLKAEEWNNLKYLMYSDPLSLFLRKDFKPINEEYGFSLITRLNLLNEYEFTVKCSICGKKFKIKGGQYLRSHKYYACSDICADMANKLLQNDKLDQYIKQHQGNK